MHSVVEEIIDFKRFEYGIDKSVLMKKLFQEFLEKNPIEKIEEKESSEYYENNAKRIIQEYIQILSSDTEYSIRGIFDSVNFYIRNYY